MHPSASSTSKRKLESDDDEPEANQKLKMDQSPEESAKPKGKRRGKQRKTRRGGKDRIKEKDLSEWQLEMGVKFKESNQF